MICGNTTSQSGMGWLFLCVGAIFFSPLDKIVLLYYNYIVINYIVIIECEASIWH